VIAARERAGRAVLRWCPERDGHRSVASFGARSETRDRRFGMCWYPTPVPVPAVSDGRSIRWRCSSG